MIQLRNFKALALTAVLLLAVVIALPACSKNKAGNTQSNALGSAADTTGTMGGTAGTGTRYGSGWTDTSTGMFGVAGATGAAGNRDRSARGTRYGSEGAAGAAGSGIPSIKITSPKNGDSVSGSDVKVKVKVSNFKLVDKQGQPAAAGEGHIHYYLDVAPPTTPGQPAMPKSGTFAPAVSESHTFKDVKPGRHTVGVQLIQNDHTPVQPTATDTITVMVQGKSAAKGARTDTMGAGAKR